MTTYYDVLGVAPDADQEAISDAFRNLAKVYHPDAVGGNAETFKIINQAYSVLKDPYKRGAYDYQLMLREEVAEEERWRAHEDLKTNEQVNAPKSRVLVISVLLVSIGIFCLSIGKEPHYLFANEIGWLLILYGIGSYLYEYTNSHSITSFVKNIAIGLLGIFIGYLKGFAILMIPGIILAVIFWFNDSFLHIPYANNPPIKPLYKNGKQVPFLENDN